MADNVTLDTVKVEFEGDVKDFTSSSDDLIKKLQDLKNELKDVTSDFSNFGKEVKNAANTETKNSKSSTSSVATRLAKIGVGLGLVAKSAKTLGKNIRSLTEEAASATSQQIRFNSTFNETTETLQEAQAWATSFSDSLYLDKSEVEGAASAFKVLTVNLGMTNEQATKASENLTMLAYDMAAVWTDGDITSIVTALRSGLAGQAKALKTYGIALDQTTLQQTLYANGIDRTVASLNSAEKEELLYYQIMKSSMNMQGAYAKAMETPAIALQTIKTQFTLLKREIGNVFLPILIKAMPYIAAFIKLLRELAKAIANVFGLEIDFDNVDYGNITGDISSGLDDITTSADDASTAVKRLTRDFDNLHIVNFDTDTSATTGTSGLGTSGLGLYELVDYNSMLDDADGKINTIYNTIKEKLQPVIDRIKEALSWIKDHLDLVKAILVGLAIGKLLADLLVAKEGLSNLKTLGVELGAVLTAVGIKLSLDAIDEIKTNGITWESFGKQLAGALTLGLGAGIATFSVTGKGGLSLKIAAIAMSLTLAISGFNTLKQGISANDFKTEITGMLETAVGTFGTVFALTKNWKISLVAAVGITLAFIGFETFKQGVKTNDFKTEMTGLLETAVGTFGTVFMLTKSWKIAIAVTLAITVLEVIWENAEKIATSVNNGLESIKNFFAKYSKYSDIYTSKTMSSTELAIQRNEALTQSFKNTTDSIGDNYNVFEANTQETLENFLTNSTNTFSELNKNLTISTDNTTTDMSKSYNVFVNDTTDALSDFFVNSSNVFSNLNTTITTSTAGMTTDVNGSYTVLSDDLIEKIEYLKDELKTQFETIGTNTTTDTDTLIDKVVDSYAELNNSSVEEVKAMKASLKKYFGEMSTDIKTDTSSLTKSATSDFENLQNNSNNKTKVFIENIRKVVDNLKDKIKESMKNAKESVSDSLDEIDKETKNTTISSPTIKTPHLSWSTTSTKAATGVIKSVLEALSLPTSLPSLNVDWYAGGGFPDKGSLFIANEREPELIGNFGNRTAVANNSQIIEGIREASYAGMKQAISESDFGGDTTVYVGNQEVAAAVTKQQKRNDRRFGR